MVRTWTMCRQTIRRGVLAAIFLGTWNQGFAIEVSKYQELAGILNTLVVEHDFDRAKLEELFGSAVYQEKVVKAMTRPAERLKWHQYHPLFVRDESIDKGIQFIQEYKTAFERAEKEYGVPAHVIAAIIGVETRYGKVKGKHRVIDSLATLTVGYPRRSEFFGSELKEFLLLTREEKMDPAVIKGSYAGAMGIPQFIASSYRNYAIDFNGDGIRDLIDEPVDAIGSVANYLARSGWQVNQAVVSEVDVNPKIDPETLVNKGRKADFDIEELSQAGINILNTRGSSERVGLIGLDLTEGRLYRVAYNNFFAIMRYNPSQMYAMAVHELSAGIQARLP